MMSLVKAELRKIFSVRSTYVLLLFILALHFVFAFYVSGLKGRDSAMAPNKLVDDVVQAMSAVATIGSFVALLLVTHEYRYNTISYTLTSARRRTQVLLAKFVAVTLFGLAFSLAVGILSPSLSYLGLTIKHYHLVHQNFPILYTYGRSIFMGWAMFMYAMIAALIIRSQVGAIATIFLAGPVEGILELVLKSKSIYLPFTALGNVVADHMQYPVSVGKSVVIVIFYLIVTGLVASALFVRRDAN